MEFVGANPMVEFMPVGLQSAYFTYSLLLDGEPKSWDHVPAYTQVSLPNLYGGIDAFLNTKPEVGLKYSFDLHAGADASQIRLRWTGASPSLDADGDIHLPAVVGELIDHRPTAWYSDEPASTIPVAFVLDGQDVTFQLSSYDHQRAVTIDPWTVNPALPAPNNRAYEVECDALGNVYAYGGSGIQALQKYDAAGTLLWTHISPWGGVGGLGDLYTTPAGDCYIVSSPVSLKKISPNGALVHLTTTGGACPYAYLNVTQSCNPSRLVATGHVSPGAGTSAIVGAVDTNGTTDLWTNNTAIGLSSTILAQTISSNGNYYLLGESFLIALNQNLGLLYSASSGVSFNTFGPTYREYAMQTQSINAIAANSSHIYFQTGLTVQRHAIGNGALLGTAPIPGGSAQSIFFNFFIAPSNSGLVLDGCNNLYVGSSNGVYKFDANLNLLGSTPTPGAVYDIAISNIGTVIAAGNGFVMSANALTPCGPMVIACPVILPVTLDYFKGECHDGNVELQWGTQAETGLDRFELEQSADGQKWSSVGVVLVPADGADAHQYAFALPVPQTPLNNYRLKMIDHNGESQYSGLANLKPCGETDAEPKIYPTITDGVLHVAFEGHADELLHLEVRNVLGQEVSRIALLLGERSTFSIASLQSGLYWISFRDDRNRLLGRPAMVVKR